MVLAEPTPVALVQALDSALLKEPQVDREAQHRRVGNGLCTLHSAGRCSIQPPVKRL